MTTSQLHKLEEEPLDDLLLSLEAKQVSAELRIESNLGVGRISVVEGKLQGAEFGDQLGAKAVEYLLALTEGGYELNHHGEELLPASQSCLGEILEAHRLSHQDRASHIHSRPSRGRWSKNEEHPVNTGYSSVPPPYLGEVRVGTARNQPRKKRPAPSSSRRSKHLAAATVVPDYQSPTQGHKELLEAARELLRQSEYPESASSFDPDLREQLANFDAALRAEKPTPIKTETFLRASSPPATPDDFVAPDSAPLPQDLPFSSVKEASNESSLPRVGRYEVLARIKRGGMGSVYMCRLSGNAGFRRLFAMKVLHGDLANDVDAVEAFFHEARVLGHLHHPHIVAINDVGTIDEPYFVLDYVEGGSLAELYRATSEWRDPALVVPLVIDALKGLANAHESKDEEATPLELVHCDITPHNLLVGVDGTCRVTDFGIAQTKQSTANTHSLSGKPQYIAPERIRRQEFDKRSDVFSMGVVLFLGLTGHEPFAEESNSATMHNVLEREVPLASRTGYCPSPAFDTVCAKSLAKNPNERYQSAEEMIVALVDAAAQACLAKSTLEIATWIRSALAPALAARRVASLRGIGSINPPPLEEEQSGLSDSPISQTRPLQALTKNESVDSLPSPRGETEESPSPAQRLRSLGVYLALTLAVFSLGWVILRPETLESMFSLQADNASRTISPPPAAPPSSTDIVLPPISPTKSAP